MASGFAALAYALIIGGRIDSENDPIRAHNLTNVYLGTGLLVFGW
jgi:Amt family ammonium transporter